MMRSLKIVLMAALACAGCSEDGGNDGAGTGGVLPPPQPGPAQMAPMTTPPPANTTPMTTQPADMTPVVTPPMDTEPMGTAGMMATDPMTTDPMGTAGMMAEDPPMMMATPLAISSSEFTDGSMIPARFRCDAPSPALTIGGGPEGTMSYAIVMTDLGLNLLHWVIYDIPADTTTLAEGIPEGAAPATPAGAKQASADAIVSIVAGTGAERYIGPCGNLSDYEFKLYAIGEAAFSGASAGAAGGDVKTALEGAALETATLTISSMP